MGRKRRGQKIDGWINLDKPLGMTSTQAVARVRWMFDAAKVGHAGTLDPLASGVLPLALGEATKLVSQVMDSTKTYEFTLRWGQERETDDGEGAICAESDARPSRDEIEALLPRYEGEIWQTPPAYSAVKVDGARAYDLARNGITPELKARPIRIDHLRIVDCPDADHCQLTMQSGKGAYVRALARDIGRDLGCFSHVAVLRRSAVGRFLAGQAFSLDQLEELRHKDALAEALLPVETALADIPALAVTGAEADRLKCGQRLNVPSSKEGTVYVTSAGRLVALASLQQGQLKPVRVFNL